MVFEGIAVFFWPKLVVGKGNLPCAAAMAWMGPTMMMTERYG